MSSIGVAPENVEAFDWERFGATVAVGCVYDEPETERDLEGQEAILEANRGWKEAFPDAHGRVDHAIASDRMVTLEITWEELRPGRCKPRVTSLRQSVASS